MASKTRKPAMDVYEVVTGKILAALESGTAPWRKPWSGVTGTPKSLSTRKPYRGMNSLLLAMESAEKGYRSAYWLTFNQMVKLGGHLKGEKGTQKGTMVILWRMLKIEDEVTGKTKTIPTLRHFTVFNLDQTEDIEKLPKDAFPTVRALPTPEERHAAADAIWDAWEGKPQVRHAGDEAYYNPSADEITLPPVESFNSLDEYHATRFHEGGHATGHATRLDRKDGRNNTFGSHSYGREELIAEMTNAFLCAESGIETTVDNSAAYLASWIKVIKADPRAVVVAAGAAQRAADMILGRTFAKEGEESAEKSAVA